MADNSAAGKRTSRLWYWLLLIPYIATLWVPFYATGPSLSGIPFFYWYLFLWIILSAVITAVVYFATK